MCKRRVSELLSKLSDEKRNEEERVSDLNSAFEWLHKELENMKSQDKLLMKKFTQIRETLNDINENGLIMDRGRSFSDIDYLLDIQRTNTTSHRYKSDPFDVDGSTSADDPLRRRAFTFASTSTFNVVKTDNAIDNCIRTANTLTQAFQEAV